MRIAVFTTGWHREVLRYIINGIADRAVLDSADTYVFNCYGEYNEEAPYSKGEYNIFNLPDMSQFDGIIIVSNMLISKNVREEIQRRALLSGKPCLSIEDSADEMDFLGVDNYKSMRELVEHVITVHGVNQFCYIGGPSKGFESEQRYRAFLDALAAHNIEFQRDLCYVKDYRYTSGVEVAQELCEKYPTIKSMPRAIICANDEMAMGVVEVLGQNRIRVPEDVIVTGFDNYERSAQFAPRLTTIDRPKEQIGYQACDHMIRKIKGEDIPSSEILSTNIIYGETCGCCKHEVRDDNEYRRLIFHEANEKSAFEQYLRSMEEELIASMTDAEYDAVLAKYMQYFHTEGFYMATKENTRAEENAYSIQRPSLARGYSSTMRLRVDWKNGHVGEKRSFSNIMAVLNNSDESQGDMFLFAPLHFQDKSKGYCVFKNCSYLIQYNFLPAWLRSINNTMENLSQKQKLFEANEKLNSLYIKDSLTGLYNRFGYAQEAITLYEKNKREGKETMIIFADLDGLKHINDTYGHEYGDIAIISVAGTIKRICPNDFIKIRYGGDEFLIVGTCGDAAFANSLMAQIESDFHTNKQNAVFPFEINASMGYVIAAPDSELPLYDFVQMADNRMYESKQKKKNSQE